MAIQACNKFKINKKQARRIYEILRLKNTNTSDKTAYLNYRLEVKNRLNAPFQVSYQKVYITFNILLWKICIVKCVLFTEKEIRNEETTESIET